MKKKAVSISVLSVLLIAAMSLSVTYFGESSIPAPIPAKAVSAYDEAVGHGYTGTVEQWLASLAGEAVTKGSKGDAGKSAYELACDNGYSGSEEEWLKSLIGHIGAKGNRIASLVGRTRAYGKSNRFADDHAFSFGTKNKTFPASPKKAAALFKLGDVNSDNCVDNVDAALILKFDAGLNDLGDVSVVCQDGKSAYELACEAGFSGTLTEWLESLVGPQGAKGEDGASAYELAVQNGYGGSVQAWLASLVGKDGASGKSAYEIAVENGYKGDIQSWLQSLIGAKGAKGDKGDPGVPGKNGANGAKGDKGDKGDPGVPGKNGTNGAKGAKGDKGDPGVPGKNGANGAKGDKGDKGDPGVPGKNGANGAKGDKGDKGDPGAPGKNGANGAKGDKGDKGDPGAPGTNGAKGDKGNDGISVVNAYINDELHLIIVLSDGREIDSGYVGVSTSGTPGTDPEPVNYTVTFKDYDGRVIKTESVPAGNSATAPADPVRSGYVFTQWDTAFDNVTSDLVVTAQYKAIEKPTIIVKSAIAEAGKSIQIPIAIVNSPGVAGAKITIAFDPKLTLTAASSGSAFASLQYTGPGRFVSPCNFTWDSESGMATGDGDIAVLTFDVSEGAEPGEELAISCSYKSGDIYDENLNDVSFEVTSGSVTVKQ